MLLTMMWAACVSLPISRIDEYREIYERWPVEARQLVLDGQVTQGMTPEMVFISWGAPQRIIIGQMLDEETWLYEEGHLDGPIYERRIVVFRGGVVHSAVAQRL